MISRRGVLGPRRREERNGAPPEPAILANWAAMGLFGVSGILCLLTVRDTRGYALAGAVYLGLLALGSFLARPWARTVVIFRLLMAMLILQSMVYLVVFYASAAQSLTGEGLSAEQARSYFPAAGIAFLFGWIPSLALRHAARRAGILLTVQVVAPVIVMVLTMFKLAEM